MLITALVFLIAVAAAARNHKLAITVTVFCLPFTQVPTFKFFMRWRISELLAWLFLPFHLRLLQRRIKGMPSPVRWTLGAMGGYFIYTGLIGIAHAPFVEVKVKEAMEYIPSPILRTTLETARGLASVSLLIGVLAVVRTRNELQRLLKVFAWSGAISGAYSLYQAAVLSFGVPQALLPETLYQEGYARPFGTFYEPTGAGSFTAATTFLTLYFLLAERKPAWLICLAMNEFGFFVSLSRAGWAGLLMGGTVLLLLLAWRTRNLFWLIISTVVVGGSLWLGYLIAVSLFGESIVQHSLSSQWLEYSAQSRIETYAELPSLLRDFFFGFGQGLFIVHGAGVAGLARLLIEGGFIGAICLIALHANVVRCLFRLLHKSSSQIWDISPFLTASYVSCFVTTLNYINVTDMWIWFVWGMPAMALWVEQQGMGQRR